MGDELKQDQFEFFYNTTKIIYDSALVGPFISMKMKKTDKVDERQAERIEKEVIPELIAFHALLRIRDIQLAKAAKAKKDKEKKELLGDSVAPENEGQLTEEQVIAQRMENEKNGIPLSEDQKAAEAEKKDRLEWGRTWVWD